MRDVDTSDILAFKEELSAILISALFIILVARLDIQALWNMGWPLLAAGGAVYRPAAVHRGLDLASSCTGAIGCCCAGSPLLASNAAVSSLFALTRCSATAIRAPTGW